jgi:hypothetical protein
MVSGLASAAWRKLLARIGGRLTWAATTGFVAALTMFELLDVLPQEQITEDPLIGQCRGAGQLLHRLAECVDKLPHNNPVWTHTLAGELEAPAFNGQLPNEHFTWVTLAQVVRDRQLIFDKLVGTEKLGTKLMEEFLKLGLTDCALLVSQVRDALTALARLILKKAEEGQKS